MMHACTISSVCNLANCVPEHVYVVHIPGSIERKAAFRVYTLTSEKASSPFHAITCVFVTVDGPERTSHLFLPQSLLIGSLVQYSSLSPPD